MNLPLFISKRIYGAAEDKKKVSRPAIRIATIGVAIGLAVMIVTVSVVLGFKHTIRDKVAGFGSHITVQHIQAYGNTTAFPVCMDDSLRQVLGGIDGVRHVERFTTTQGILKTNDNFLGAIFKGVGPEYDTTFLRESMVDGDIPSFCDTASVHPLLISKTIANKLRLSVGDRVYAYFINDDSYRTRRYTVSGIYQTYMKQFDDLYCLTDLYDVNRLNGYRDGVCTGAELLVDDFGRLEGTSTNVRRQIKGTLDAHGNMLTSQTITEAYPQVFSWLDLLDVNVKIILALMIALAAFTMISGLLIIILERTQMIGLMKAMGARNSLIRRTFLWFAVFIIGRGLLWGNVLGIGIVLLQQLTGLVKLDPETYYVTEVPMELNLLLVALLNVATLLITIFILIGPSYLVSRIHPARSMRYE